MADLLYDLTYTGPEVQAILDEAHKLLLGVYATQSWVLSRGYATQQWVDQQTANFVTQSWVQQQGYLTSAALTGYATEQWVTQNYVPLSGNSTISGIVKIKSELDIVNSAGTSKIAMFGSSGQIHATNVYIGGTENDNLAATHGWVTGLGYQANAIETVKVNGSALTVSSKAVDIPLATDDGLTAGVVLIGDGLKKVENHLQPDYDYVASRVWVGQQGYLTSADLSGYATQQWVEQNYVPLSGNSTISGIVKIKSELDIVNSAGTSKIAMFGSSGQIHATNVYIGGTANDNLAATQGWVTNLGYQANVIETVKVNGSALTVSSKAVDIPLATDDGLTAGVVLIGDGLKKVENHLQPDYDYVASRVWVGQQGYLTSADLSGYATQQWVEQQGYLDVNDVTYLDGSGSVSCQDITSSDVKVQSAGMTYSRTGNSYTLYGNNVDGRLIVNARFNVTGGAMILVTVTPSTERNYDFGVVGFMDQATLSDNDVTSQKIKNGTVPVLKYSSGTSAVSAYIIASPGSHSIEIGYVKDSSSYGYDDKVTVSFKVVGYATQSWVQVYCADFVSTTDDTIPSNTVLAGPSTGTMGTPNFRSLTQADLPSLKTINNESIFGTGNIDVGGGGSSTLAGLTDVNISGVQNGQVLTYNSSTGKWVNAAGGGGGGSSTLSGLTDVSISSVANGNILVYNSSTNKWVNSNALSNYQPNITLYSAISGGTNTTFTNLIAPYTVQIGGTVQLDFLPIAGGTMNGHITMASSYGIKYQSKNNDWMLMGNAGTKQLSAVLSNLLDQLSYYIGAKITMSYNSATDSYTFTTVSFPQEYHGQSSGFFYVNGTIGYDWQYQQSVSGYAEVRIDRMVFELSGSTISTPVTTSGHVLVFNGNGQIIDSGVTLTTDQLSVCTMEAARLFNAYHGKRFIASTYTETVTPSDILCNFMLKSDGMQELDKLESVVFLAGQVDGSTGIKIVVGVPTTQSTWDAAKTYIQNRYRDLNVWVTADGSAQISGSVKKSFFSPSGTPSDMGSDLWNDYMYKMYSVPFTVSQGMTSGFTIVIDGVKISDGKMYEKRFNIM